MIHLIIKQFDCTKYLGITFGSNLTWKSHINELCLKHIKNSRYLVKSETFCWQPYSCHALLLSHLSFPHLWCPCLGFNPSLISNTIIYYPEKSNQNNIFLRTKIPFWASVQISQLTKLNDITESQILYFVYQWSRRLLPPYFSEYFKFTSSVHSYSARQSCNRNLYVASINTTQYRLHSQKFTGPHLWNSLPRSITNSNSLRIFCKTLKN